MSMTHPSRLPAPTRHLDGLPIGQRISEPWLRAQLPGAVLARPDDDPVDRSVWWAVAQCLEATAHAMACAQDGTDPSSVAVLATFAMDDTATARAALLRTWQEAPSWQLPRQPGGTTGRSARLVPVERTWFRLAGLLAGAAGPELLAAALADHRAALGQWRQVLLGPARLQHRVRRASLPV
jgi:hypothetical protein